jgi:toxin CptA
LQINLHAADNSASDYFRFYPSLIFSTLLSCAYALALLIVLLMPLEVWIKVALAILLLFMLQYYLRYNGLLLASASIVAMYLEGGDIFLILKDGKALSGKILPDSLVTPLLTILNVQLNGNKEVRSVAVYPDSLDAERFRELRVLLRWGLIKNAMELS